MKAVTSGLAMALALGASTICGPLPARADEPVAVQTAPRVVERTVVRPRRIVRPVIVERPVVYRIRRIVREVVVERPVFIRPRPVFREVYDEPYGYGPPPPYFYRRPFYRPYAYGRGGGPGFGGPFGPRPIGFGYGPRFGPYL